MNSAHQQRSVWPRLPPHAEGLRVGLYGGSFNPPHAAHRLLTMEALKRLRLDQVWWLVTPGNPLKETRHLAPLAQRLEAAHRLARHPRVHVTALEAEIGTRYTLDTVRFLRRRLPRVRFVWLMGADNLAHFHRWQGWREIAAALPIAVFDRPGYGLAPLSSKAALALTDYQRPERLGALLAGTQAPAWTFLHQRLSPLSSTALRGAVLKPQ